MSTERKRCGIRVRGAALVAAALLAGCAGGEERTPAPEGGAEPAEDWTPYAPLVSAPTGADGSCAALLSRFERALHPPDPARYRQGLEETLRLGRVDLDVFESFRVPETTRHAARVVAAALAVHLVALAELAEASDEGNEGRARLALERAADARRRAEPFARRLGLASCAAAARR